MSVRIIGTGVGRTGTHALMTALNQLGLGPCHHMAEVIGDKQRQVPLWQAAADGHPDWAAIYNGYPSAMDWPTATFFRELNAAYPQAKFILSVRSTQSWAESFSETIYKALGGRSQAPAEVQPWLKMVYSVVSRAGFPDGLDMAGLMAAFDAHVAAVQATVPAERLLMFRVADGWEPLCAFLGVPVPDAPFPRTNDRSEFWERLEGRK